MDGAIRPDDYEALFLRLSRGDGPASVAEMELDDRTKALAGSHRFFHWPLEFPDVFTSEEGGFDADVGNPPWDVLQPSTQEFYIQYDPNFRKYGKQDALNRIKELHAKHPDMATKWKEYEKLYQEAAAYAKEPAAFTALTAGKIDLYKAFLERFFHLLRGGGRMGIVVPSGLYTDQGCQPLRRLFFSHSRIHCLYGFENRRAIFNIHRSFKFILFCTEKGGETESFRCAFMEHDPQRLPVIEENALMLSPEKVRRYSPDSLTIMEFKSKQDADITEKIYNDWPLLHDRLENSWNISLTQDFNLTSDSHLFNVEGKGIRLYEGKAINIFDHQYSEIAIWIEEIHVRHKFFYQKWRKILERGEKPNKTDYEFNRIAFRRIAASTNERTFIATVLPSKTVCPHTTFTIQRIIPDGGYPLDASAHNM